MRALLSSSSIRHLLYSGLDCDIFALFRLVTTCGKEWEGIKFQSKPMIERLRF